MKLRSFHCPECNAHIKYDTGSQIMFCQYCGAQLHVDDEVRKIMEECYARAKKCLSENKDLLENIAKYLLEVETLNYQDILEIQKTGSLSWWEDKKKADKEKNENVEVNNQEVPLSELKKVVDENINKPIEVSTNNFSLKIGLIYVPIYMNK